jgi:hypothetical protein
VPAAEEVLAKVSDYVVQEEIPVDAKVVESASSKELVPYMDPFRQLPDEIWRGESQDGVLRQFNHSYQTFASRGYARHYKLSK